ncbi:uncharacterized protein [Rutidosis leptorrhynchoides]|uniref:uncharacterized protein n=1 Tax=Rutidosis leptorrhynchoides TaxID=125765 RepID=UPI003A9978F4
MSDINHFGMHFTWNQRPQTSDGIFKKINRVMGNNVFIDKFGNAFARFQPYRLSDHCPAILCIPSTEVARHRSFKFGNFIVYKEGFDDIVFKELDAVQLALDKNPFDNDIRDDAGALLRAYNDAVIEEERFLKQKSKIEWLRVGDNNSHFFTILLKENNIEVAFPPSWMRKE